MKALDERRILAPADIRFVVSFPRYGRLKLEVVLEQINSEKKHLVVKAIDGDYRGQPWQFERIISTRRCTTVRNSDDHAIPLR